MHMAQPETPKKRVTKRGRPSGKPNANDYCRICKCQFKLSKCSTINIFERSAREHFKHFILADLCQESNVILLQADNLSNRVCITCGKKLRDFCLTSKEILEKLNKPHESFIQYSSVNSQQPPKERFKRQIPTTCERSPTARKVSKDFSENVAKSKRELFEEKGSGEESASLILENPPASLFLYNINIGPEEITTASVKVAITTKNGNVSVHHVNEKAIVAVISNLAKNKLKSAAFAVLKCQTLLNELLVALNKQVTREFKAYCRSDTVLKGNGPDDICAFSNKILVQEVRVHLPVWNACIRGACKLKIYDDPAESINIIALATATAARRQNARMSAVAYRLSTILFHSGINYEDHIRLNRLGVCMSPKQMIRFQKQMGHNFDSKILLWKSEAEKKLSTLKFLEEVKNKQLVCEESDMDLEEKEIILDRDDVGGYSNFNESVLTYGVQLLDKSRQQMGRNLPNYSDDILHSAVNNLKKDDIPYYK